MTATIGLISDIHGNRVALEAVIADGRAGVQQWWALGDLVAIGPQPSETLELLTSLPGFAALAGNTERYVLTGDLPEPFDDPSRSVEDVALHRTITASFAWTLGAVGATGWAGWLRALPGELRTDLPDGTRLLCVHSEPGRDDGPGLTPERSDEELLTSLDGTDADLVCGGHTHRSVDRRVGPVRVVNLGSVGNPVTDDRRASYVIVHSDRHGTDIEHRRVAYDSERFVETVRASSHPAAEYIIGLQTGANRRFD